MPSPDAAIPDSPPPRAVVPPSDTPSRSSLTALAFGVVAIAALYFGREVLVPVTLAILLSFLLGPIVGLLRRLRLGRVPSVLLAVLFALSIVTALGSVIGTQIASLAGDLPKYETTITHKIDSVRDFAVHGASRLLGRFVGLHVGQTGTARPGGSGLPGGPPAASPPSLSLVPQTPTADGTASNLSIFAVAERILSPVLSPLATAGIVFVVAIFALLQKEDLRDRLIRLFGSRDLHRTTVAMDDAAHRLSRYFLTQLGINTSFGVVIGAGLFVIGVPSPALWGILAGLLRFVPYVGSFIAAAAPVALSAAVAPDWSMTLWTAGLFVVVETITGQLVEPMVYGHSTGLSPFSVVVAAIFWTWIWGPIGLILSTPLTLCLVVLGRHMPSLEFLEVLLGDRPALTPIESFYQRMLAGDPDEAQQQAEILLKERSLTSYYDEVALKGLQLAANDARRGVLTAGQLERIKDSIRELVHDLAGHDDVDPPAPARAIAEDESPDPPKEGEAPPKRPAPADHLEPEELPPHWRGPAPMLCIAGSGQLDEAVSTMLIQLLGKHGIGARLVPHEAVSRSRIAALDTAGTAMVCVSYLEVQGTTAQLRYLVRRLRRRVPGAPVLVGIWPSNDAFLTDNEQRADLGADYYVTSLDEAVRACLEQARRQEPAPAPAPARRQMTPA
ncbi:MAG: AI-2E family transporter [Alphaproteobacteria bacterium]|nr:AI-2E family transporter [Alphaproteobacteria bacterium]